MSAGLVVLGATGDLSARYVLPGLARIEALVDGGLRVVGVANDDLDDDGFRRLVHEKVARHAGGEPAAEVTALVDRVTWVRGDVTEPATLQRALGACEVGDADPLVLYLALPHVLFLPVVRALRDVDLPDGLRVVVEKPFGEDLAGAAELNAALGDLLPEEQIFRVDHFLAKQTVLNLLGLRFANRILEPLWSSTHVASVDIVFDETVDAQGRASYYDRSGALRDMVQNHLLQLLTYVAMEPPTTVAPADLAARKADVLRAVRPLDREGVARWTRRGRYTAGEVAGRHVDAYADAPGVDPARATETYAEVTLHVDTWRWSGVPFRLRTGKALAADRREIVVRFRDVPLRVFDGPAPVRNELRLQLDPDRMSLDLNVNGIDDPFRLETVTLDTELARQDPTPYGQLLLAVIDGDTRLSARAAEAEEGWRIVEPVLAAWADGAVPLEEYAAGSDGPRRR
ncbi:glucose-6-phosphate 1-dehydrogenase [Cellulomonas flavigena DSM 20109]|uniref:Glucose-6-phosphate 1-dehydrogenase n=1 Tax=Cellulomonas flavigena (strain ATCC 482 / DSM 20109 / BCRC 11376 / JCM 18109 / NBRC 3775 / NCIMB 8073 / NRS 134) TaxID=446466 RepID=D5UFP2_CELFN|nr:glucose-6-phosphate dehydrogenase [Cellulomonas flavigena]ADG73001.1 glucose-6-phosphate 1-dehydrogenase [Cellulomonas flavigena DSM 20109]